MRAARRIIVLAGILAMAVCTVWFWAGAQATASRHDHVRQIVADFRAIANADSPTA
jgi:hypothetical protein